MARSMTIAEKILCAHSDREELSPGQLVECDVDIVLANDITAPIAIREFEKLEWGKVFDKDRICLVGDHYCPNKDIKSAIQAKDMREFARKYSISHYFDVGRAGIEHSLLPERGIVGAGDLVIGADSHTCTYGALGALSTGMGSTDIGMAFATGKAWFKVPATIKVVLTGKLPENVYAKDIMLNLIGMIGVDGALYQALEFYGDVVDELEVDDRMTISNMAIECGAKAGIFPVDAKTLDYLDGRFEREPRIYRADDGAEYSRVIEIDCSKLKPTVALPHLPSNIKPVDEVRDIKIDQSVIGSCTNGHIGDMRVAASILKGHKVAPTVRCIVIPATQEVFQQCVDEGLMDIFLDAECAVSTPTCGPCLGGYMGVLAPGERSIATTNRNFVGRMGDATSEVVLSSPAVAAASAILGRIGSPDEID
ncbi:MAG: 3-isopropylmalate dehydratase large subunit [Coriobacteriales bacterium]|jgi:3-isopropylmalate/(R)-2-methylmalate dehydratase large subunit